MIVDDRRVIVCDGQIFLTSLSYFAFKLGSANFNDRSQRGDGDSEIALVVEDSDEIRSSMNGREVCSIIQFYKIITHAKSYSSSWQLVSPQHSVVNYTEVSLYVEPVVYSTDCRQ